MEKLILLVGASGAGKTTIAKELEKLGCNIIHSYTTREPRKEGEWGHIFVSNYLELPNAINMILSNPRKHKAVSRDDIIAFFNDYRKNEVYFATKEQYQGKGTSIYIVDPDGANQVKENVKDAEVITIFLMADAKTRRKRMLNDDARKNTLIVDRIRSDYKIFKTCKCNYVIDGNRELEEVIKDVIEIIEEEI